MENTVEIQEVDLSNKLGAKIVGLDPDLARITNRDELVAIGNLITCTICFKICLTEYPHFCPKCESCLFCKNCID